MPDSKAFIEIKVNDETIISVDTEYVADSCFLNGIDSWAQKLKVNGDIELIITPNIDPPKLWERIKLFFWDLLYRFEKEKKLDQ